ncbi:hypothetical protein EZV73_10925 [Acidaminobacter sp. JC074]|uniref:hypothetical protein n=1 Tax=Acidaminobacter sp. JC074 TaxID=2530199 RepID=UPI001F0ED18A|nr:hypothetical protein [Acidaminobacter sp. JC074]MCH4888089.1 hypothetical protein [Acidaminobacter sp. JC074]
MISSISNINISLNKVSTVKEASNFEDILRRYESSSMTAKEYLSSLSPNELKTIKDEMRLEKPLNPLTMSDEGATNLLINRHNHYAFNDIDKDHFFDVGNQRFGYFPSSAVPNQVLDAWNTPTKDLSEEELLEVSNTFWGASMLIPENMWNVNLNGVINPRHTQFVDYFVSDIPSAMRNLYNWSKGNTYTTENANLTKVANDFLRGLEEHYGKYEHKSINELPDDKKPGYHFLGYLKDKQIISIRTYLDMLNAYE